MPNLALLERILWWSGLGLSAALLIRLVALRLFKTYPAFSIVLFISVTRSLTLMSMNVRSDRYAMTWMTTEPLLWAAYVAVGFEIYYKVLASYRGLSVLGRGSLAGALSVAVVAALVSVWPQFEAAKDSYPILYLYFTVERFVAFSMVIFLLLIAAFLAWYSVPLRRNLIFYAVGYSVWFIALSSILFVRTMAGAEATALASTIGMTVHSICFLAWIVLIRKSGEQQISSLVMPWNRGREAQLLAQLEAVNAMLVGLGKKT
jgi:hypothetical protein